MDLCIFVIIGFLAWESTSVKTWETLWLRGSTGSVTGNYLQRRQQQTELRPNDIVLIQEHNPKQDSDIRRPSAGGVTQEQFTKHLYIC